MAIGRNGDAAGSHGRASHTGSGACGCSMPWFGATELLWRPSAPRSSAIPAADVSRGTGTALHQPMTARRCPRAQCCLRIRTWEPVVEAASLGDPDPPTDDMHACPIGACLFPHGAASEPARPMIERVQWGRGYTPRILLPPSGDGRPNMNQHLWPDPLLDKVQRRRKRRHGPCGASLNSLLEICRKGRASDALAIVQSPRRSCDSGEHSRS